MAKDKPVPGKMVNKAPKIDLNIVNPKGKNLAGPPRSAGLNPGKQPGKQKFDRVRNIGTRGR